MCHQHICSMRVKVQSGTAVLLDVPTLPPARPPARALVFFVPGTISSVFARYNLFRGVGGDCLPASYGGRCVFEDVVLIRWTWLVSLSAGDSAVTTSRSLL